MLIVCCSEDMLCNSVFACSIVSTSSVVELLMFSHFPLTILCIGAKVDILQYEPSSRRYTLLNSPRSSFISFTMFGTLSLRLDSPISVRFKFCIADALIGITCVIIIAESTVAIIFFIFAFFFIKNFLSQNKIYRVPFKI